MSDHKNLKRRIELWHTGISKLPLNEYLGVSKEELQKILEEINMEK
jgi:hypothetical protein